MSASLTRLICLANFGAGKMARYMIPEHILFLDKLPKKPTEKVAKVELKKHHADVIQQRNL